MDGLKSSVGGAISTNPTGIVLRAARGWLGTPGRLVSPAQVELAGPMISYAGSWREPRGGRVIDLGGGTLIPGMIDTHVHLGLSEDSRYLGDSGTLSRQAISLRRRALVEAGITTVRDCGWFADRLDDIQGGATLGGPNLLHSGAPLTIVGGHCSFLGGSVITRRDIASHVVRLLDTGASFCKIMVNGGFTTSESNPSVLQFSDDDLSFITDLAHSEGLLVSAHAHSQGAIRAACAAGVDTLEHASFLGEGGEVQLDGMLADQIAASGVAVSLTLNGRTRSYEPEWWLGLKSVGQALHARGVRLMAGTDLGVFGIGVGQYLGGLRLLSDLGLDNAQVLAAATSVAADGIGLGSRTGSLASGFAGDVVCVGGNPLVDIDALGQSYFSMVRGELPWPTSQEGTDRMRGLAPARTPDGLM